MTSRRANSLAARLMAAQVFVVAVGSLTLALTSIRSVSSGKALCEADSLWAPRRTLHHLDRASAKTTSKELVKLTDASWTNGVNDVVSSSRSASRWGLAG